jgi:DNA-3-methyladenine glycosylase I
MEATDRPRCAWAAGSAAECAYHDTEWGVPEHDDRALFELLCLEGAQAGLSWRTVLLRRDGYRDAFAGFDIARCAALPDATLDALCADARLIRHRGKITSVRDNARAALALADAHGGLARFLWSFIGGAPRVNAWPERGHVPARTPEAEAMSKALRAAGFRFAGPTICYAFMQASGMVNDHVLACFRHRELS